MGLWTDIKVIVRKKGGQIMNYQKIKSSHQKLVLISNDYFRGKDSVIRRQKLSSMLRELSAQIVCLSEQNFELMRKLEKQNSICAKSK